MPKFLWPINLIPMNDLENILILLTYEGFPSGSGDDQELLKCLEKGGIESRLVNWRELPEVEKKGFKKALIRTPWDYAHHRDKFFLNLRSFVENGGIVLNSLDLMEWNSHKAYLRELEKKNVPIIPMVDVKDYDFRWPKAVIKPYVSASSYRTKIFHQSFDEEIKSWLAEDLNSHRNYFIQPYCEEITTVGEYSLIYFHNGKNGFFSHACQKIPKKGDFRVQEEFGGEYTLVSEGEELNELQRISEVALKALPSFPWIFARFDYVSYKGQWCLGECEVIEPDLYLRKSPASYDIFTEVIKKRLNF